MKNEKLRIDGSVIKKFIRPMFMGLLLGSVTSAFADLKVATSIEDLASVAQYVGGTHVSVVSLTKGYQNPHYTPAKPSLMKAVQKVDVFVCVGLDLESGWLPLVLPGSRNPRIQPGAPGFVDASEGIQALEERRGQVNRAEGDVHPLGNPHYYMAPENLGIVADHLEKVFSKLDAANSVDYAANTKTFKDRLARSLAGWRKALAPYKGKPVVTFHHNYPYFIKDFGLKLFGTVEPKPGIPPSPRHLDELSRAMRQEGCKVILYQPYFEGGICRKLAERSGAIALEVPSEVGAVAEAKDVFSKFDLIVSKLAEALGMEKINE